MDYIKSYKEFILTENLATFIERNRDNVEKIYYYLNKSERILGKVLKYAVYLALAGSITAALVYLIKYYAKEDWQESFFKRSGKSDGSWNPYSTSKKLLNAHESLNENQLMELKIQNIINKDPIKNQQIVNKINKHPSIIKDLNDLENSEFSDKTKIKKVSQEIDSLLDTKEKQYINITWLTLLKSIDIL